MIGWPQIALTLTWVTRASGPCHKIRRRGVSRMTLHLINVWFGSSLSTSTIERKSRSPVTLLREIPVQRCHFLSSLNSLLKSAELLATPVVALIKPATVSAVFPHISHTDAHTFRPMCRKLQHGNNGDYGTVSNYFYDLIISGCGKWNSCCQGFVSVARVVILLWKWSTGKAVCVCWHTVWQRRWLVVTGCTARLVTTACFSVYVRLWVSANMHACKLLHGIGVWTCKTGNILLT